MTTSYVSYSQKAHLTDTIAIEIPTKANKTPKHKVQVNQFDSSHIQSVFLDPKILERRVIDAKRGSDECWHRVAEPEHIGATLDEIDLMCDIIVLEYVPNIVAL